MAIKDLVFMGFGGESGTLRYAITRGLSMPAPPTAGYGFMVIAGRDEDEMLDVFLGESENLIDVFEDQGA